MTSKRKFMSPVDVPDIPGTEGWERMYPYYYQFGGDEEKQAYENNRLWYIDAVHYPEPMYPFDLIWDEAWFLSLSQFNTRVFMIPPALGVDHRIVNGYIYISPISVDDPKQVEERVPLFLERAGYYYENWDDLYARWKVKMQELIKEIDGINFIDLPETEDSSIVFEGVGLSSGYQMVKKYDHLMDCALRIWQYHMEFLNLGYAAYVTFRDFCQKAFPGLDDSILTRMVGGIDIILWQPDEQLKKLARAAVDLKVADLFKDTINPDEILATLEKSEEGKKWLEQFEESKDPWFYMSSGTGWYHDHYCWLDRLEVPFAAIQGYILRLEKGESLERATEKIIAEKKRIVAEYRALLQTDEDRDTFDQLLAVAERVYPYVEEHLFFVEHHSHSVFYMKVRQLAQVFVNHGLLKDAEDIWFLHRDEIKQVLFDLVTAWATGVKPRGIHRWLPEIEWRKGVMDKFREQAPLPALGIPPEVVTEPFTIMLWGVTSERIEAWLDIEGAEDKDKMTGFPGSPGAVEGIARIIRDPVDLAKLEEGEILVAPTTSPSWAPIFGRIKAAVTDVGGIMSHAAIVCREYGLPAVVGSGYGTALIKTGDKIRVDGYKGTVEIIRD